MGYTHYYSIRNWDSDEWQKAWPQIIKDAHLIMDAADVEISGPTEDEEIVTPPTTDVKKGIYVNGVGDDSHEPFIIHDGKWTFCKTARKPYDVVVTAILIRAFMLAPNQISVSSDGDWEEWSEGRELYQKLWPGETIQCPLREDGEDLESEEESEETS